MTHHLKSASRPAQFAGMGLAALLLSLLSLAIGALAQPVPWTAVPSAQAPPRDIQPFQPRLGDGGEPAPPMPSTFPLAPPRAATAQAGERCTMDLTRAQVVLCSAGLLCYPQAGAASLDGRLGVCVSPLRGVLLPESWPASWPAPLAYFP